MFNRLYDLQIRRWFSFLALGTNQPLLFHKFSGLSIKNVLLNAPMHTLSANSNSFAIRHNPLRSKNSNTEGSSLSVQKQ